MSGWGDANGPDLEGAGRALDLLSFAPSSDGEVRRQALEGRRVSTVEE